MQEGISQPTVKHEAAEAKNGVFCEECGKELFNQFSLQRHHALHHSDDRPFLCPVAGCKYATEGFPIKEYLTTHMKNHHADHQPLRRAQPVPRAQPMPQALPTPQAQPMPQPQPMPQAQPIPQWQPMPSATEVALQQTQDQLAFVNNQLQAETDRADYYERGFEHRGIELDQARAELEYQRTCFDQERQRYIENMQALREEYRGREEKIWALMDQPK